MGRLRLVLRAEVKIFAKLYVGIVRLICCIRLGLIRLNATNAKKSMIQKSTIGQQINLLSVLMSSVGRTSSSPKEPTESSVKVVTVYLSIVFMLICIETSIF